MPDFSVLEGTLGCQFNTSSLLQQALVHSSYFNENTGLVAESNERLEFLGDAILGLIIAEKLYTDYPDLNEGEMTRLRAALVCRDMLQSIAGAISLGNYLFLGKGEEASGGRRKPANLARALEALLAAVFLDQGLAQTKELILKLFDPELKKLFSHSQVDYKSRLQELVQARGQLTPTYQVIETVGPDHSREFTVEVSAGDKIIGIGSGKSKKAAETEAARVALSRLTLQ